MAMGRAFNAVCRNCKQEFEASEGGGMLYVQLRCDRCGQPKDYNIEELAHLDFRREDFEAQVEKMAGNCNCGGAYTWLAKPRCPNCGSDDYEMAPNASIINFD
jgi:Zn finger protein HypA/HybF involved in hydrogenase expression